MDGRQAFQATLLLLHRLLRPGLDTYVRFLPNFDSIGKILMEICLIAWHT